MDVIRHQNVGMYSATVFFRACLQDIQIEHKIEVAEEAAIAVISSLDNVKWYVLHD